MQELVNRAKELLESGEVARVLGWKAGDLPYNPEPAYFNTVEELKDFVYNGFCGANLSKYMIEASKLEGKTMVLSDNSGSAWGTLNTEYGSVKIAEIGNLSAVLTAMRSNDGYVGVFGDKLYTIQIDKNDTILNNLEKVNILGQQVGFGTENGLWIFLENAITNTIHWDNLFIYSDMQAGRGELYCLEQDTIRYQQFLKATNLKGMARENYINVLELLDYYRSHIHPNLNVFSIQTAGYDNNVLPNYLYRGALLTGWTGKEALFAKTLIDQWNQLERKNYDYS